MNRWMFIENLLASNNTTSSGASKLLRTELLDKNRLDFGQLIMQNIPGGTECVEKLLGLPAFAQ